MNPANKLRFHIINNVTEEQVNKSKYLIYLHACSVGNYVGMSSCPVKRWQEHYLDANNKHSHNYTDSFKEAIRLCGTNFKHYIIGSANFESAAKKIEAAAIEFYNCELNTRTEVILDKESYNFKPLGTQLGFFLSLEKKSSSANKTVVLDKERITVIAEIYEESGRKRLRVIDNQPFPKGMKISCSRAERERFEPGDKVMVRVSPDPSIRKGTTYLVTASTYSLKPFRS